MALQSGRGDGLFHEFARGLAMPNSSRSTDLLLPFGSLTGVIPVDVMPQWSVLRDFGSDIAGSGQCIQRQIHPAIVPAASAPRGRREVMAVSE